MVVDTFVIFSSRRCYSCKLSNEQLIFRKVNDSFQYKVTLSGLHQDGIEKYYRNYNRLLFSGVDQTGRFKVYITGRSPLIKNKK